VKLKLSLYTPWTRMMGEAPLILDVDTRLGKQSAFRPGRLTPGGRAPGIHWIGSSVEPNANTWKKRKIFCSCQEPNHYSLNIH